MNALAVVETARALVAGDRGLLTMDAVPGSPSCRAVNQELASARLSAMNVRFTSRLPWALAFSFAHAIQHPALEIWRGEASNVPAAQQALYHRAECNRAAHRGEYTAAMEKM